MSSEYASLLAQIWTILAYTCVQEKTGGLQRGHTTAVEGQRLSVYEYIDFHLNSNFRCWAFDTYVHYCLYPSINWWNYLHNEEPWWRRTTLRGGWRPASPSGRTLRSGLRSANLTDETREKAWDYWVLTRPEICVFSVKHKVLTYVEYRAMSGVFQNIDPTPPLRPAIVSSPRTIGGGNTLARGWGGGVGGQYFGRRQTLDWPLTV